MMPKEALLYSELRSNLDWPWMERVENRVNLGTPDVHFRAFREWGWIELKREAALKPEDLVALRKEQVAWHAGFARAGGSSWIILQAGAQYFLWRGGDAVRVRSLPLKASADLALFWGQKTEFYQYLRSF